MTVRCEVFTELEGVEHALAEWDALAVEAGRPYCAPAWQCAWWRHAAPSDARLRVLLARDGDRLVGVAPFYASRWTGGRWSYALLGAHLASPIEPLARPDLRRTVARAFVSALACMRPSADLIRFDGVPVDSPWPEFFRSGWGGRRAWLHRGPPVGAPAVTLAARDLDEWLSTRSANFRQQMRRARRGLEKERAVFRASTAPEHVRRDVVQFTRLHEARWSWRGGSNAMGLGVERMLIDAGCALVGLRRFKIASIEIDGEAICSLIFVAAGSEIAYWNGGFDDAWKRYSPSQVGLVEAVRAGLADGYRRLDLGPGAQPYKARFADRENMLAPVALIPPGPRHPLGRVLFAPFQARIAVARRLTPEQKRRIRSLLRVRR